MVGTLLLAVSVSLPAVPVALERTPSLSPFTLELARKEVVAISKASDVRIEWVEGLEPQGPVKVVVLFRDSRTFPLKTEPQALGIALLDSAGNAPATRVLVVFPDRLERLISCNCPLPMGRALGRAIAHEIGHALKYEAEHSARGLMRASIPRPRWLAAHRDDFFFAAEDAASIRERLARLEK